MTVGVPPEQHGGSKCLSARIRVGTVLYAIAVPLPAPSSFLPHQRYLSVAARGDVSDYIERFHNPRKRRRLKHLESEKIHLTQLSVETG